MSTFQPEYKTFFESPAGAFFLTSINNLVDDNHQKAEGNPELARDYTQRAKGNREVIAHINSLVASKAPPS